MLLTAYDLSVRSAIDFGLIAYSGLQDFHRGWVDAED